MGLKSFLGLSTTLAKAAFKEKHEGSYLGMFWYLLNPLLIFLLLYLVFSDRLGQNIPNYPLYLLLGIILYNFFQSITGEATIEVIKKSSLIKSINFPYASLIGSIVLKTLLSHIFEIFVFTIFLLFLGVSIKGIIFYPIILFFFSCFVLGLSLILSSFAVYFTDLQNIWGFISRLLFFATPIFYSIENQKRLLFFNLFNPLYYFITVSRDIVIYQKLPPLFMLVGIVLFSIISILIGFIVFNKLKPKFAGSL